MSNHMTHIKKTKKLLYAYIVILCYCYRGQGSLVSSSDVLHNWLPLKFDLTDFKWHRTGPLQVKLVNKAHHVAWGWWEIWQCSDPDSNQAPLDSQSNALPLRHTAHQYQKPRIEHWTILLFSSWWINANTCALIHFYHNFFWIIHPFHKNNSLCRNTVDHHFYAVIIFLWLASSRRKYNKRILERYYILYMSSYYRNLVWAHQSQKYQSAIRKK